MKPGRIIPVILLFSFLLNSCQIIGDRILNSDNSKTESDSNTTVVKVYNTPLEVFEPMQFVWFYKPPEIAIDREAIAGNFSLIILTRNDEGEREEIRASGYNQTVIQYLRAEAIMDPGSCTEKPFQNQTANLEGDYCQIESRHSDWFLKDINGNRIQYDHSGYVFHGPRE